MNYVPIFIVDSLLKYFKAPNFIEIEVEVAELFVIQGIDKILDLLYIEVGEEHIESITQIFIENNYNLFDEQENPIKKCIFNTLAMPN